MFLRRKKLILILILIGIAWAAIASFLGQRGHTKIRPEKVHVSANHQPEFYYDTANEEIEIKDKIPQKSLRRTPSTTWFRTTVPSRVNVEQLEQEAGVPNSDHELDELEGEELPVAPKYTPRNSRRFRVISVTEVPSRFVEERRFVRKRATTIAPQKKIPSRRIGIGNSPGFNGTAVVIDSDQLSPPEKVLYDVGWQSYAHNEYVSRQIPLRRVLPDVRDPECALIKYDEPLHDVSVIVTFHNEAWTTLLRAVYSIIDRSPPQMLTEIILFDDGSDSEHLKQQLDDYVLLLPKVRLVRSKSRLGVVSARQEGSALASASILVFLDSHVECATGWLEPLVDVVAKNHSTIAIPIMDIIDDTTFQYKPFDAKSANIGGFDWNLQFVWTGIPERERKRQDSFVDPIKSPTMSGGMYAISRKWFDHLGGYDTGMDMWGAENLEMSFRTWMCGGSIEVVPCSHVGHVFRKRSLYRNSETKSNPRKNSMRLAEVWMDEFKEHFYDKIGGRPSDENVFGDLSDRVKLRENLKCKSFKWYLNNVIPELFVPQEALAVGEIRSNVDALFPGEAPQPGCLDSIVGAAAFNSPVKLWPCHGQGGNQYWLLSASGEIRRDDGCFDYAGANLVIYPCHGQGGNQQWQYTPNGLIRHIGTKRCLELSSENNELLMNPCSVSERQVWQWKQKKLDSRTIKDAQEGKVYFDVANKNVLAAKKKNVPVQELADDDY